MRISGVLRYRWLVCARSGRECWRFLRRHGLLWGPVGLALGTGGDAIYRHAKSMSGAALWEAMLAGLAGVVLLGILRFVWALIEVPAKMHQEQEVELADARRSLGQLRSGNQAPCADMKAWHVLEHVKQYEPAAREWTNERIASLLQQRASEGRLKVWGMREEVTKDVMGWARTRTGGVRELIPPGFFVHNVFHLEPGGSGGRVGESMFQAVPSKDGILYYHQPMFCRAQVEALWPRS